MKKIKLKIVLLFVVSILFITTLNAQVGNGPDAPPAGEEDGPDPPPTAPINNWVPLLIIAGVGIGYRKFCYKTKIFKKVLK